MMLVSAFLVMKGEISDERGCLADFSENRH
jgi:hypothetical protein